MERTLVSVVAPVFNEIDVLDAFYARASAALRSIDTSLGQLVSRATEKPPDDS